MKKTGTVWIWLMMGQALLVMGQKRSDEALWNKAEVHYQNQNWEPALEYYEILASHNYPKARARLGEIHLELKHYPEATQWLKSALDKEGFTPESTWRYASLLRNQKNYDEAARWYAIYQELNPEDPQGLRFQQFCQEIPFLPLDTDKVEIQSLPFNSRNSDFAMFPYEKGWVFSSDRPNAVAGLTYVSASTGRPLLGLYYTEEKGKGKWKTPKPFLDQLNPRHLEGTMILSPDGKTRYYSRSAPGNASRLVIVRSQRTEKGWGDPVALDLGNGSEAYPSLSRDGNTLYFASDRPEGQGGWDLYSVALQENTLGQVKNLGAGINSPGDDIFPYLHWEAIDSLHGVERLYFSSDGHPGYGGMDLFRCEPGPNGWKSPQNLGRPLNSSLDDFSLWMAADGSRGFLASNRISKSQQDDLFAFTRQKAPFENCPAQKPNFYCYDFKEAGSEEVLPFSIYYQWYFGDGDSALGLKPEHCFQGPGSYNVRLFMMDSLTGNPIFQATRYLLEIKDAEQPYINWTDSLIAGTSVQLDAHKTNLPDMEVLSYYWEFPSGASASGPECRYTFSDTGTYSILLGVTGVDRGSGLPLKACVIREVSVGTRSFIPRTEPAAIAETNPPLDTSFQSSQSPNPEFGVQLGTSKTPIALQPEQFKGLSGVEEYIDQGIYRYIYGRDTSLTEVLEDLRVVQAKGYTKASLLQFEGKKLIPDQPFTESWLPVRNPKNVTLIGTVVISNSNIPVQDYTVIWQDLNNPQNEFRTTGTNADGFVQKLEIGKVYGYYADLGGYFPIAKKLDLRNYQGEEIINDTLELLGLKELAQSGDKVRLDNIYFEAGSDKLKRESFPELNRVKKLLLENPRVRMQIEGHTDNQGDADKNIELSLARTTRVLNFLIEKGVSPGQVQATGYGESRPLNGNSTPAERRLNRRIEFRILRGN